MCRGPRPAQISRACAGRWAPSFFPPSWRVERAGRWGKAPERPTGGKWPASSADPRNPHRPPNVSLLRA
eukprot:9490887-Pyramimonas_sp.AAC.1